MAFTAEYRRQVDAFYRAALEAGGKDSGAPGLRPHYHANYYAAFVIDPDGHDIEVVCHEPEAEPFVAPRALHRASPASAGGRAQRPSAIENLQISSSAQ
jgi:hypothetical protein